MADSALYESTICEADKIDEAWLISEPDHPLADHWLIIQQERELNICLVIMPLAISGFRILNCQLQKRRSEKMKMWSWFQYLINRSHGILVQHLCKASNLVFSVSNHNEHNSVQIKQIEVSSPVTFNWAMSCLSLFLNTPHPDVVSLQGVGSRCQTTDTQTPYLTWTVNPRFLGSLSKMTIARFLLIVVFHFDLVLCLILCLKSECCSDEHWLEAKREMIVDQVKIYKKWMLSFQQTWLKSINTPERTLNQVISS